MSGHGAPSEYESEPIPGLPETLPEGEIILWQGSPSWRGLARRAFHVRKLAIYFGLLLAWSAGSSVVAEESTAVGAAAAARLLVLAGVALGILAGIAWLNARAALFTITNRRVVLRFGVAIAMAVNVPFREVRSAGVKLFDDGTGDIALAVAGVERLGFAALWPFARPWRFGQRTEPVLRAIPDAEAVADTLAEALHRYAGPAPASEPRAPDVAKSAAAA